MASMVQTQDFTTFGKPLALLCSMKVAFLVALSLIPSHGQAQTVTLYDVGAEGFIKSNVSISVEGVNAQGATIYSFEELKTVTITTDGVETVTLSELWAGTLVEDASHELLTVLPTAPGGRGVIASCTYAPDGLGACLWEEWSSGGSTDSYSFDGSAFPFYTLILTSSPTSLSSDATITNPIPSATITSSHSGTSTTASRSDASIIASHSGTSVTSTGSGATIHVPIGPIVGAIIGGLAVLGLALFLLYRRHRNKVHFENIEKLDLKDSDSGHNPALLTPFPLPHEDLAQHHPIDPTRLVYTYAGPRCSIEMTVDADNLKAVGMQAADGQKHQSQAKAGPPNAPIPLSTDISPTTKHPVPCPPAQNDSGHDSDLRPQLEALRAEVELLREQQSMAGFELLPPRYTN